MITFFGSDNCRSWDDDFICRCSMIICCHGDELTSSGQSNYSVLTRLVVFSPPGVGIFDPLFGLLHGGWVFLLCKKDLLIVMMSC